MKFNLLLVIVLYSSFCNSQITVNVQLPGGGLVQKDQLWNIILINNGRQATDVNVLLTLQDARTGQTVLSGTSSPFTLSPGARPIFVQDVQPVQYNYYGSSAATNFIPLGSYVACYRVNRLQSESQQKAAEECISIHIQPLSPPLLNTPANKSEIETVYPQFSWTPPAPIDMFNNLTYDIEVTEVMTGQSPEEAVMYNNPIFLNDNLTRIFENYPSSYEKLDTGKTYAWQVTCRSGMNFISQTNVWTFRIKPVNILQPEIINPQYITLKRKDEGGGMNFISDRELYIKYYSYDRSTKSQIKIVNVAGDVMQHSDQVIEYGNNFLRIKLNSSVQKNQLYKIELTDLQGVVHTASFIIQ